MAPGSFEEDKKTLQQDLHVSILLAEQVIKQALVAESSKTDCIELSQQTDRLCQLLRSVAKRTSTTQPLYERPIRRIVTDVHKNLEKALTLVRKCKKPGSGVLRQVFAITSNADFRKVSSFIESSIGDMKWVLSVFESDGTNLTLPPIASNDPTLAWVWSYIATIQMGGQLKDRADAANSLASLATGSDRNKKMIVDEGGVQPLLRLLKEGGGSLASAEAQIAAADALMNLGSDQEGVGIIVNELGVPVIVKVLGDSPMRVQVAVANLVGRMAELDDDAREEFARENVIKHLIRLLSIDTVLDDPNVQTGRTSIHSLVQINRELSSNPLSNYSSLNSSFSDGSSRGAHHLKKDRELETPEMRLKLKVSSAAALGRLCKGSFVNSKKICETKGLLCLAKIVEVEKGELQLHCLTALMEIAGVAEDNADLRRSAFKTNSPAAKAVLSQLLRILQDESDSNLLVPAIKSIGSLARSFPARETRIISPLVKQLGSKNVDVAIEAAIALKKFVQPDNFNCVEHSKAIIEFDGVPPLVKLLKVHDRAQVPGLVLLCYLALHVGNSKALEQARALNILETTSRSIASQRPELKELLGKAMHHLTLYQPGVHHHRQLLVP